MPGDDQLADAVRRWHEAIARHPERNRPSVVLVEAAEHRDRAEATWLSNRTVMLTARGREYLIDGAVHLESSFSALVADDKGLTKQFLLAAGVPTPRGRVVASEAEAQRFAREIGGPLVVKPRSGYAGHGVAVGVSGELAIAEAYRRAARSGKGVLVEESLEVAEEVRCLVTPEDCFGVVRRVLPQVVGDGRSTVQQLVAAKNALRRQNPMLERLPIPRDRVMEQTLADQGLTRSSVPAEGQNVLLRRVGGLSGGGEPHEVSDVVDPQVRDVAVAAAAAIPGLHWSGVDIVIDRASGRPFVLEVNVNAGFGGAMFPMGGTPRDVAGSMWDQHRDHGDEDAPVSELTAVRAVSRQTVAQQLQHQAQGEVARPIAVGEILERHLRAREWSVASMDSGIRYARGPGDQALWFGRSGVTTVDMLGPRRVVRRHHLVREAFLRVDVPCPAGALLEEPAELDGHFPADVDSFTLVSRGAGWGDRRLTVVDRAGAQQALQEGTAPMVVQQRLRGTRVRVYAHRGAASWILGAPGAEPLPEELLQEIAATAVRSVRAIPELRWSVVSVVVDEQAPAGSRAVAEGLIAYPLARPDQVVLGGSAEEFAQWLLEASQQPAAGLPEPPAPPAEEQTQTEQTAETASAVPEGEPPQWPRWFSAEAVRHSFGAQRLSAGVLALEAWRRGMAVTLSGGLGTRVEISDGTTSVAFNGSRALNGSAEAARLVEDKHATSELMRAAGVPVPAQVLLHTAEQGAQEALETVASSGLRWPLVIKPVGGSQGKGVFVDIGDAEEFRGCYEHLAGTARRVVVEEHAPGEDYRVYVLGDDAVAVCRRIPAFVVGDGRHTVRQLIRRKNGLRRENPFLSKGLIRPDREIDEMLQRQGLGYAEVPGAGDVVALRRKANASAGGDVEDVTDAVPAKLTDAAVRAVAAIPGLQAGGVDVLYDASDSETPRVTVLEINARAHIGVNMYPTQGQGRDLPARMIEHFFPDAPERPSEVARSIGLNMDQILAPLRSGSADGVRLPAMPGHLYPVRRLFRLGAPLELSEARRSRVLAAMRACRIAGSLRTQDEETELVVAGETRGVEDFCARFSRLTGVEVSAGEAWTGVVRPGFRLD